MLPDYPELKEDVDRVLREFLQDRIRMYSGFLAKIPRHRVHEGRTTSISRSDGSNDTTDFTEIGEEVRIFVKDIPDLTLADILKKLDGVAKSMAEQQSKFMLSVIDETTEKTGNVVSAGGKPFSADLFISMLEKIELTFDKNGQVSWPSIVSHPSTSAAIERTINQISQDKDLRKKIDRVIAKKREEWRAREADRRVVG